MLPWRNILLATDFSLCSEKATHAAVELAAKFEANLTLVHVWEIPVYVYSGETFSPIDMLTPIEQVARKALAVALETARKRVPCAQSVLRRGAPAYEIVAQAQESKTDLVVIGTHGRRGPSHLLLGSVAERVVQRSPVPVLTIRSDAP